MFRPLPDFPTVARQAEAIRWLKPQSPYNALGLDLEFDVRTDEPTVLGLSDGVLTVSVAWEAGKQYLQELMEKYYDIPLVGHNVVGADMQVLAQTGMKVPLARWEDTILLYYLTNAHLCKSSKKSSSGDDEGEKKGRGFMNLWAMCSQYTDLTCWKFCREVACEGPCPKHDVYGYCGLDALGALWAYPQLVKHAKLRDVYKLYDMHKRLMLRLAEMQQRGVYTDREYIARMRDDFESDKRALWNPDEDAGAFPFNPRSGQQVKDWFSKERNIKLKSNEEEVIRDAVEKYPECEELALLLEYKELGNGPDRWFASRKFDYKKGRWKGYVDDNGIIRPSIGPFTSTGRLMCTNPNLQNVAARRIDKRTGEKMKKRVRRAICAPEGHYLVCGDWSNAENRIFLHLAGYDIPRESDLHQWVVELAGIKPEDRFAQALGGPRDAAKSVGHAGHYLEGLSLQSSRQLASTRTKREIEVGARIVYEDWKFEGETVTFTGANLAKRAFGSASHEHRRAALAIGEKYFARFSRVRDLQRRITAQIEKEGAVRPPTGYVLSSYGYAEDRIKTAAATWGSNPVAHLSKLALLAFDKVDLLPVLQVHDELLAYAPKSMPEQEAAAQMRWVMEREMPEITGLIIPTDIKAGANWADAAKIPVDKPAQAVVG